MLQIDNDGLDEMDLRILEVIISNFHGGPVGLKNIAVSVGEEEDSIEDVYEPFLIQKGFLVRTPKGRVATPKGVEQAGAFRRSGAAGATTSRNFFEQHTRREDNMPAKWVQSLLKLQANDLRIRDLEQRMKLLPSEMNCAQGEARPAGRLDRRGGGGGAQGRNAKSNPPNRRSPA